MQLIIATHGKLASGYANAIQVLTQATNVHPIGAYVEGEDFPENLNRLFSTFPDNEPILLFTDLMGGSVSQTVVKLAKNRNAHIIAGINLPLVLEFVVGNVGTSKEEIEAVIQEAKAQIVYLNSLIEEEAL